MSWSNHLYQRIIEVGPGIFINRHKFSGRRNILFPRDILAAYIRHCMDHGHENEVRTIAREWAFLFCQTHMPPLIQRLPPRVVVNQFLRPLWKSVGTLEDIRLENPNGEIMLSINHDILNEKIGANPFGEGSIAGILSCLYRKNIGVKKIHFAEGTFTYVCAPLEEPMEKHPPVPKPGLPSSSAPEHGVDLRRALDSGVLTTGPNNLLLFRETPLIVIETTFLHMLGNQRIALESIPPISNDYFSSVISPDADENGSLILLKTLFECLGWGLPLFAVQPEGIDFTLKNAPAPLGPIGRNEIFYLKIVEGFLQRLSPYTLTTWSQTERKVHAHYAKTK